MIEGANASAARSKLAPSAERQIATAPGHGSAKIASRCRIGGSSAVNVGRSSTTRMHRPDRRRRIGRRAGAAARAAGRTRPGSIDCARTARPSVSVMPRNLEHVPPAANRETDHVAGGERERARRQRELGALAAGPQILQPDVGAPLGRGVARHHREIGVARARGAADEPARGDGGAAIVGAGVGERERDLARKLGLLCPHQARRCAIRRQQQIVFGDLGATSPPRWRNTSVPSTSPASNA